MGLSSLEDFLGWQIVTECTVNQGQLGREVIRDLALVHHDSSSVTMETGKPGLVSAPAQSSSVAAPTEKKMDIQAPLTAVYIQTVPALQPQPYPQAQPLAAHQEPATLHLAMPPLYSKETLPFLTFHIAGGLQSQQQGLSLAAAAAPVVRPKSAGKHVCPHCGRDCMKPSVLEKHLRCHTGERPYPCTTCGVSFKTQSNLYKHKRTQAHARLSSESEQSSLGSQDSLYSSRETCTSSSSLDGRSEESGSLEKDVTVPSAEITCPASTAKVHSVKKQGPDTGWTAIRDPVNEPNEVTSVAHKTKPNESLEKTGEEEKQKSMENEKPPLTANRHLPLQRQEATLFSKQWESSVSRGKSQSHESTDSGFSESSEQYPSPGSVLPDHSMDSLTESTVEHLEQPGSSHTPSEPGQSGQEPKDGVSKQEQKTLEERISKLISENSAVVEDKHLENVRPRKTVLSKQGSIDLPMPYTYKDSFHFDMRLSKAPNVGLHRNMKPSLYSSVPTQRSTTMEHAPLTRSSSLPFSVTLLQPERSNPTSSYQRDYVTVVRRGSSGQIHPTGLAIKSVDQQASTHRPLVRQTAVDCNHATDGLFMNSSVEEACTSSLSCDGDGSDICGEPSNRKFRRKKAQKFAYNKWYMYGGGTFKKLYNAEKGCDNSNFKARKSLTNPEHEVVQGMQKTSAVHKDIATTTGSTTNSTSSSATVCHPCCLPANLPPVSGVDFNQKASQLHSSCAPLKTPLLRNLSLSTLQLSSTGSSITHNTDSISRAEAERLINKEKQTDSISHLCGAHIPSDRKKQRTDDKIICPVGMETDPNPLTQLSTSVTCSVSKQDTNLGYINLQTNQKRIQLKGTLFPPCIINANETSVSTSPTISILSTAKTSFLPKYQLKLPNAAEPDSNPSPHTLNQPTGTDDPNFTSDLPSLHTDQTASSITTSAASGKKCTDPSVPRFVHTHNIRKANSFSSGQGQLVFPLTATTLCQSETSVARLNQNVTPNVVHRQFTTITTATTSVHDHHTRLCTTLMQSSPSKPVVGSAPTQLPRAIAPVMQNIPATPIITTEKNQPPAVGFTAFSQSQHPPLSHSHPSPTRDQLKPANRVTAGLNAPAVPCHIVPFDSVQPAAQNVFHVQTADLQICLQIISDEQLALIEPQIERQVNTVGTGISQRNDLAAMDPEVTQNKVQSSVMMENTNEGRDHEKPGHQKEMDQREPSPSLNTESIKPSLSVRAQKTQPNTLVTEHGDVSQATISVESSSLPLHPHKYGHVNMVTESMRTTSHATSAVALLKGVKSGRSQTSEEEEHVLSLSPSAEEHLLPDRSVSQGGPVSETLSGQHKVCLAGMTSLSPSTAAQSSTGSGLLCKGSQHKLINQRATCNAGAMKTKCKASETRPSLQAALAQASSAECVDTLPRTVSSFPINNCKAPREVIPQAIYSSDLVDSRLVNAEILQSSKHANMGWDRVGPLDHSAPSQDMTLSESQDIISSARSETLLGQFTSVSCSIQVERPKDVMAVLTTNQSPVAGLIEGGSLAECAAQKEPETRGHGGTPGQPDSTDWEPKQSQEAGETDHQCMEGQESGGVAGENETGGMRSIKTEEVLGQWGKSESNCRYIHLPDMIKPEEEERTLKTDSYKNCRLSEQHHQHLSQTQTGMSEYPPQPPQQGPCTSNDLNSPASSHTSLFPSPQPELDMNNFYFSQQQWEMSITHNPQTQILSETGSTFSHRDHQTQDQEHTRVAFPVEAFPPRETITAVNNSTLASCSSKPIFESHAAPSLSSAAKTSSSTHPGQVSHSVHVSRMTGDTQATNNRVLDDTMRPSKPWTFIYSEPDYMQESEDRAADDHRTQSSNASKYQSFFSAGQLHGYQPPECLTGAVRPVQSCQDYPDDTSSSDDEGKLIIEL